MKSFLLWTVSLLGALNLKAQNTAPTNQSGFKLVFEKSFLHTDRDVYTRGDTLWFKAYLVNAQDNAPATSSGNLHVELISPDAKIIASELIRLDSGLGNGDFDLADTLAPGKYRLRAYTNWMRNFGDNFIFEKEITLLNTEGVAVATAVAPKGQGKKTAAPVTKTAIAVNNTATITLPLLTFYPEGGSLVEGISSFVAVKAEDGFGKGLPASGTVLSSSGDTVAHFSCDTSGMGLFALIPVKGQNYHAVVDIAKRQAQVFELPSPLSKGLTMQVKQTDSILRVVVSSSADPAALPIKPAYKLTVKHGGIGIINQPLQPVAQQTVLRVPTVGLPEGINAITLYDENNKPNCERLVYIHHRNQPKIVITTDKKTYQPKEKVTAQIRASPNTNLSMAVLDAGLTPPQADDIVSYLMLQSEVKGNVEHASRYFDTTNINRSKQLDLLLMTQGWRDFVWRRLADTAIRISYSAENDINVSGVVKDEVNNKPIPNLNITLFADAAKGIKIFTGNTNATGSFNIPGMIAYGVNSVKLASVNDKGEKRGVITIDSLQHLPVEPMLKPMVTFKDSIIVAALKNQSISLQKNNIKGVTRLKEVTVRTNKTVILRGGAVLTPWGHEQVFNIKPDDIQYKTLEWYLLQCVKGAQANDSGVPGISVPGIDTISMGNFYRGKIGKISPRIFVNGQELSMDNKDQADFYNTVYYSMPIQKFKAIVFKPMAGTLHGLDAFGYALKSSAESIIVDRYLLYLTMIDDYMIDNPGSIKTNISGYYQARTFYQPPPNAKLSMADFRTTIHWEPYLKTDAQGKALVSFYTGSAANHVNVIVQGLTAQGVPLSAISSYTVKSIN